MVGNGDKVALPVVVIDCTCIFKVLIFMPGSTRNLISYALAEY